MLAVIPYVLRVPGTWVDLPDQREAFQAANSLRLVRTAVGHAAIALGGCLPALEAHRTARVPRVFADRAELEQAARNALGIPVADWSRHDEVREAADRIALERTFEAKRIPADLVAALPVFYGRAFVHAIHETDGHIRGLATISALASVATAAHDALAAAFPDLALVRNSVAHVDERARGIKTGGKAITPLPIISHEIHAPGGGVLVLDSFHDSAFTCTLADGRLGRVPVTPDAFARVVEIVQTMHDAITWHGSPSIEPRA